MGVMTSMVEVLDCDNVAISCGRSVALVTFKDESAAAQAVASSTPPMLGAAPLEPVALGSAGGLFAGDMSVIVIKTSNCSTF